jgi:hypothetical protein
MAIYLERALSIVVVGDKDTIFISSRCKWPLADEKDTYVLLLDRVDQYSPESIILLYNLPIHVSVLREWSNWIAARAAPPLVPPPLVRIALILARTGPAAGMLDSSAVHRRGEGWMAPPPVDPGH